MCFVPKVPEAQQYQAAQAPVFNENETDETRRGRRGTIAAQAPVSQGAAPAAGGKTLLGQ